MYLLFLAGFTDVAAAATIFRVYLLLAFVLQTFSLIWNFPFEISINICTQMSYEAMCPISCHEIGKQTEMVSLCMLATATGNSKSYISFIFVSNIGFPFCCSTDIQKNYHLYVKASLRFHIV